MTEKSIAKTAADRSRRWMNIWGTLERNRQIATNVLNGETLRKAAGDHNITYERVRIATFKYCKAINPKSFAEAEKEAGAARVGLMSVLRKKSHLFTGVGHS